MAELRSLLAFLYLQGLTPRLLSTVVPPVAGWRDTGVPKAIPAADVARLLGSCDRHNPTGVRDFAILMLVARLGVRSVEVARLELGDIDWRAGQIMLRGKASRQEAMPLPVDVGEALTAYLMQARPSTRIRNVFLAAKAPMRPIPPGLVADVTHRACDRAGLPRIGAHRLRHSLATDMLRRGATIIEVSQVLRHRDLATTAIYAKVDDAALRSVARSWPGAPTMSALSDAARTTCGCATVWAMGWPSITVSCRGSWLLWMPPVCPPSPSRRRWPGRRVPESTRSAAFRRGG